MGGVFSTNLTDAACVVHQFKVNGYSATTAMGPADSLPSKRLAVGGYEWEVHYTPSLFRSDGTYLIGFKLVLVGAARRRDVKAALKCRLVCFPNPNRIRYEGQTSHAFKKGKEGSGWVVLCKVSALEESGAIKDDSFTVECTITVIAEQQADQAKPTNDVRVLLPSSGLHHHLGELLQNGTGADVSFVVSGEVFAAHKAILASRSPVFMAQFFGRMKADCSKRVEVKEMEPAVFRAMLHFIYTDSVPDLDRQQDGAIVAQHLLAAADRYGLDKLKLMCEYKLYDSISVNTAATTLALAEQHGCLHLKAKCVELIAANLDAVMATEGYRHLLASCPLIMNDLLKAVRRSGTNN